MNATRDNRQFGAWTVQVRAIAVAHYFVAVAHLSLVYFIRGFWEKAIDVAVGIAANWYVGDFDRALLRSEFAKLDYFVYVFMAVICVFTMLIALNGFFLARGSGNARISAIIIGALLVTAFPIGTAVGIWFIYVLVQRDVVQAFEAIRRARCERRDSPSA